MSPNRSLSALPRTALCIAALAATAVLPAPSAQAGSVYSTSCLGSFGYTHGFRYNRFYGHGYGGGSGGGYGQGGCVEIERELVNPYIIAVPQPQDEKDIADAAARQRLWQARCRPVIRQDQNGVRRYHYAAPGCEYGKYE